ncbi:autotransporter outer membrane beta-barrel domain-containing protein [Sutterella sp.]|uniref:autotransporter outer membrane beta-barrel domain-containing protein n=1 Tax=Sutterella sp. TaxID=1981025 RepID=UPI0026DFD4B6|nr:autotransporter outer membrane beta-barrel domain-containing protein [Sutterella sp.]MDO5532930.1 autotransporter outer membrane beta-barrel domain-containing protein [Sutterella sp.]
MTANTLTIASDGAMILTSTALGTGTSDESGKTTYTSPITSNVVNDGTVMFKGMKLATNTEIVLTSGTLTGSGTYLSGNILYEAVVEEGSNKITFGLSSTGVAALQSGLESGLSDMITQQAANGGFDSTRTDGQGYLARILESTVTNADGSVNTEATAAAISQKITSAASSAAKSGAFETSTLSVGMITGFTESRLGFNTAAGAPATVRLTGMSHAFSLEGAYADVGGFTTMTDSQMPVSSSLSTFADDATIAWVSPVYTKTKSDGFGAGNFTTGVDADLYGVALGVDWAAADDTRFGIAFQAGTGDIDSNGTLATSSTDYDYYGVTAYFGRQAGDWTIVGDVSFGYIDGDVTQYNAAGVIKADSTSKIFSASAKARYTFETEYVDIAPYFGARFNFVHIDSMDGKENGSVILHTDATTKTYAEIPLGIQFSKPMKTSGGIVFKPVLDLSVIPVIGDKNLETTTRFTGVDYTASTTTEVLDRVNYSAKLGLTAEYKNVGFGLGVGYLGSENVDNYSVTANLRFAF